MLTKTEQEKRSRLKERKPYVYEKIQKFTEKYKKGESIAIVQFQYNYKCNFKCVHCSIQGFQHRHDLQSITLEDVKSLSRQADELGLARFVITGGEPLTFTDLDDVIQAIDPNKFYINIDTNGWFLTPDKAQHLAEIGVDRIQLSIDSLDPEEHDNFRRAPGSFKHALAAMEHAQEAGLDIFIQTVVTKQRLYSQEFLKFVKFFNKQGIMVFVTFAKPVGAWEGNLDIMIDKDDLKYFNTLEQHYMLCSHLTPGYELKMGCIAVKGMFSVTQYGDVLPCPYMHISIGNILKEPLADIIQRGLGIKYFGEHIDTCPIAMDKDFICNKIEKHIYGKPLPVWCGDVFDESDKTIVPFYKEIV